MENRNGMKEFFVLLIAAWHNLDFVFREEKTEKKYVRKRKWTNSTYIVLQCFYRTLG